jgi:hypothetical protein
MDDCAHVIGARTTLQAEEAAQIWEAMRMRGSATEKGRGANKISGAERNKTASVLPKKVNRP